MNLSRQFAEIEKMLISKRFLSFASAAAEVAKFETAVDVGDGVEIPDNRIQAVILEGEQAIEAVRTSNLTPDQKYTQRTKILAAINKIKNNQEAVEGLRKTLGDSFVATTLKERILKAQLWAPIIGQVQSSYRGIMADIKSVTGSFSGSLTDINAEEIGEKISSLPDRIMDFVRSILEKFGMGHLLGPSSATESRETSARNRGLSRVSLLGEDGGWSKYQTLGSNDFLGFKYDGTTLKLAKKTGQAFAPIATPDVNDPVLKYASSAKVVASLTALGATGAERAQLLAKFMAVQKLAPNNKDIAELAARGVTAGNKSAKRAQLLRENHTDTLRRLTVVPRRAEEVTPPTEVTSNRGGLSSVELGDQTPGFQKLSIQGVEYGMKYEGRNIVIVQAAARQPLTADSPEVSTEVLVGLPFVKYLDQAENKIHLDTMLTGVSQSKYSEMRLALAAKLIALQRGAGPGTDIAKLLSDQWAGAKIADLDMILQLGSNPPGEVRIEAILALDPGYALNLIRGFQVTAATATTPASPATPAATPPAPAEAAPESTETPAGSLEKAKSNLVLQLGGLYNQVIVRINLKINSYDSSEAQENTDGEIQRLNDLSSYLFGRINKAVRDSNENNVNLDDIKNIYEESIDDLTSALEEVVIDGSDTQVIFGDLIFPDDGGYIKSRIEEIRNNSENLSSDQNFRVLNLTESTQ